jgi:cytochrome c556
MKKIALLSAGAAALFTTAVQAADPVQMAVEYRQALMNVYAWNLTSIRQMVKGDAPFDAAVFARHAKDLAAAAQLETLAAFPEDSINDESDAREEIWLDFARFQERHQALREQSAKLAEVAAGGDEAAMKAQFGETGKTCKGCHDDFKN